MTLANAMRANDPEAPRSHDSEPGLLMNAQLPPATQKQFENIVAKLIASPKGASEQTSARSEFMNFDGAMGGQVLTCNPNRVLHGEKVRIVAERTSELMQLAARVQKAAREKELASMGRIGASRTRWKTRQAKSIHQWPSSALGPNQAESV